MKNELKTSKNYIEYLKKELDNAKFLSEIALKINGKIIQEEDKVRELEKEIRERDEDIERRFKNIILINIILEKMTRKEQVKILDDKIKANNAQYNLDRMNAEISACSSGDLPKYEYFTKKDLGYKPDAFEQANFEYSPLCKVFTD